MMYEHEYFKMRDECIKEINRYYALDIAILRVTDLTKYDEIKRQFEIEFKKLKKLNKVVD